MDDGFRLRRMLVDGSYGLDDILTLICGYIACDGLAGCFDD